MPWLIFRDGGIVGSAEAGVAVFRVRRGMRRVNIIGINDVAGGAAAGAIVAGMIIGARKGHDRIQQTRFLQAEKNGVRAQFGAESAVAELVVRFAGIFLPIGIADFAFLATAAFENSQDIAGLGSLPTEKRIEFRQDAFGARFVRCGRGNSPGGLGLAVAIVALAEASI